MFHTDGTFISLQYGGGFVLQSGMKNKAVRRPLFALAAAAAFALLPLAGCGSGGGTSPVPSQAALPSTVPSTSPTRVTVVANYDVPDRPVINVTFPADQSAYLENLVEYHVYRNDVIVGRFTRDEVRPLSQTAFKETIRFTDSNQIAPFDYRRINPIPVGLIQEQSTGSANIAPLSADTPIVYRITLITGAFGLEGLTTYTETEIGRSNPITPFR